MKIGTIELRHGLFLAPLAGYSDYAMRRICREAGAEYLTSEMISAQAVCYGDKKTAALARLRAEEAPCALQLFGRDPAVIAEAARRLTEERIPSAGEVLPAAIDINMGCPVPKIVGNGEGSALLRNPALAAEIVAACARAVKLPVTVKMRIGWDAQSINAVDFARRMEDAGAAALCVHGRTRAQMYAGHADLSVIAAVCAAVRIPVIGNGDITDPASAARMRETGCAGIMIGRGAVGNPFLFRALTDAAEGRRPAPPSLAERVETALRQLRYAAADKGEIIAVRESRKQIACYVKGAPNVAAFRAAVNAATTYAEVEALLQGLLP